ncbi:MAG: c-type cytochrome [Pseudomonadota bacterium]|nr:MAG: c-type cytochrome [Pseudomonadota bacterium]
MTITQLIGKTTVVLACGAAFAMFGASSASAADIAKIAAECDSCHGKDGASTESSVPTIAGMSATYLSDSMKIYKKKERPCVEAKHLTGDKKGKKSDMCKEAADLSDADAKAIAKYYAGKKFVRAKQPFDAAKAKRGKSVHDSECIKCHEKGGSSPDDDAGILAGQWMSYMRDQFVAYRNGKRPQEEKMKVKMDKLSKDDEEALLHFYASQQ